MFAYAAVVVQTRDWYAEDAKSRATVGNSCMQKSADNIKPSSSKKALVLCYGVTKPPHYTNRYSCCMASRSSALR